MPDADIVRVLAAHGIELVGRGRRPTAPCPMHGPKDRHVLTVDVTTNTWTCPSCSPSPSSAVEFIMKIEGVSRHHALELLRAGAFNKDKIARGPRGRQKTVVPRSSTTRALSSPFSTDDNDAAILTKLVGYYKGRLGQNAEALDYFRARGLRHSRLVEHFKLGLADRTLALRLPMANRKTGAELRGRLQRLGVLRPSGHEHLNGCLVVPLFDAEGHVTNMYGRKIGERLRAGTELHVWLRPEKTGVFNLGGLAGSSTVIVTASILDALTLWSFGVEHVTAIHGLDGPVDDLLNTFSNVKPKKIIFVFRRTPAADAAIDKLAPMFVGLGAEVFKAVLPADTDVNDLAVADDARDAIHRVVRTAQWVAGSSPRNLPTTPTTTPRVEPTDNPHETVFMFEDRRWRIRGLGDNTTPGTMRVNVFVSREEVGFHVDVFDMYSSRHRTAFVKLAGIELGVEEAVLKRDLGRVLLALEQAQEALLAERRVPEAKPATMTDAERDAALELLRDPRLVERIAEDFERLGMVGERDNLLLAYLVAVSRLLRHPLAAIVQSSSAAGKSSLMSAALSFVPEEDKRTYSAITGQSLFYMGAVSIRHKVLAIAEEMGVRRAAYALKLLQSDGGLTISSTTKEPGGRLVAHEYTVEGPVAILTTTTSIDVDDELLSRCLVLTVDEGPEQTRRIHEEQRRAMTLDGLRSNEERAAIVTLHQNAQRLLRPVRVVHPRATEMTFADARVRARRDHRKLLGLVETLALLHQHQRQAKTLERDGALVEYIEVEEPDVALASKLATNIVGGGLDDLPPQTKRLLDMLDGFVRSRGGGRFRRRDLREHLGLGDTQLKVHLQRLVEAEFIVAHRTPAGLVYSLANCVYDDGSRAADPDWSGVGRPLVGPAISSESESASSTSPAIGRTDGESTHGTSGQNGVVLERGR